MLRYLPSRLSNREIGAELYVSLNTVKSHVKAIYRKLDVDCRDDAVRAAASSGSSDPPGPRPSTPGHDARFTPAGCATFTRAGLTMAGCPMSPRSPSVPRARRLTAGFDGWDVEPRGVMTVLRRRRDHRRGARRPGRGGRPRPRARVVPAPRAGLTAGQPSSPSSRPLRRSASLTARENRRSRARNRCGAARNSAEATSRPRAPATSRTARARGCRRPARRTAQPGSLSWRQSLNRQPAARSSTSAKVAATASRSAHSPTARSPGESMSTPPPGTRCASRSWWWWRPLASPART